MYRIFSAYGTYDVVNLTEQDIDNINAVGHVKLNGMEWTARSTDGHPIAAGTLVTVDHVEGVKAFVTPVVEEVNVT